MSASIVSRAASVALLAPSMLLSACSAHPARDGQASRFPDRLDTVATVIGDSTFVVGEVVLMPDCSLVIAGARWGTIVRVDSDGRQARVDVPEVRGSGSVTLHPLSSGDVIISTQDARATVVYSPRDGSTRELFVQQSVAGLGVPSVGAFASIGRRDLVVAPFGERSPAVQQSSVSGQPAMVHLDSTDASIAWIGEAVKAEGRYLPALLARRTIVAYSDSIFSFRLTSGVLDVYRRDDSGSWHLTRSRSMKHLWRMKPPSEILLSMPWIDEGVPVRLTYVPYALSAAFRPSDASLFAIRPYSVTWLVRRDDYSSLRGRWRIDSIGLEQYDREGNRVGAFALAIDTDVVKASDKGYLVLRARSGKAFVVKAKGAAEPCLLPRTVKMRVFDLEPPASEIL